MLGAGFTWVKWLELNGNHYFMRKCLVMAIWVSIFSISAGQLSSWSFFSFTTSWQPSTKLQRWSIQGVDYNYLIRQIPANLPILTLFLICYCITFCILYYNALYFKFDINLAFIKPVDALTMACLASITLFQSCQHRCQYMRERVEPLIDFKTYWFLEFHRSSLENLINCLFTLWLITMSTQSQYVHSMWYNVSIGRLCNVSVGYYAHHLCQKIKLLWSMLSPAMLRHLFISIAYTTQSIYVNQSQHILTLFNFLHYYVIISSFIETLFHSVKSCEPLLTDVWFVFLLLKPKWQKGAYYKTQPYKCSSRSYIIPWAHIKKNNQIYWDYSLGWWKLYWLWVLIHFAK